MSLILNHYDLLGVGINAHTDEIIKAYEGKVCLCRDSLMKEQLDTAYYVLSDGVRRQRYDLSMGIHRYRKVPKVYRIAKGMARLVLTVADALLTFYWCFFFVVAAYGLSLAVYKLYKENSPIIAFMQAHKEEITILVGLALEDGLLHFYVRRANRKLKHYNWEIKEECRNGRKHEHRKHGRHGKGNGIDNGNE